MRTHRRLLALFLALGLVLAACGDDDATAGDSTTDSSANPDENATAEGADGTVTIEHAYGETVVDDVPERIVTLGTQWNGVLLEMEAPIVGYADDGYAGETGLYPWEAELMPDDVTSIPIADGIPHEQVAALEPDLIVVTHPVTDQAGYDALDSIAPTVPLLGDREVDLWQDLTTVAGEFMRDEVTARAIIEDYDEMVVALAAEYPGLDGKTYAFANYVPGDALYVVADPEDGSSLFFNDLGMSIAPAILDAADGASGRAQLSLEQVELLDADLIGILTNGGDVDDLVGFDRLPAVRSGALAEVPFDVAVALNTPNALSLRWALDQIRPGLEAAAD